MKLKTIFHLAIIMAMLATLSSCNDCTFSSNPLVAINKDTIPKDTVVKIDTLDKDMIIYYKFDELNARDYSGNSNHGSLAGAYSFVKGKRGDALRLIGEGSTGAKGGHVLMPFIDLNKFQSFTASIWVYEQNWSDQGGGAIFTIGEEYAGSVSLWKAWGRPRNNLNRKLKFSVGSYWDGDERFLPSTFLSMYEVEDISEDNNNWVMYTLVYENQMMKCYRNAVLIGTYNQKVKVAGNVAAIGRHWWNYGQSTTTRFTGYVDEFRLYGRSLSGEHVQKLYLLK